MAISGIREASRLIFVDELTGLYNRRFMRQYLRERLDQLARQRTSLCVIMLDLDGFKQINDTYGHLDGDFVLKRLADLVRAALPANAYAIRFAGDEFFAFLEGVDASEGVRVAEGVRQRVIAEPFVTEKAPSGILVRISLGVAAYPEEAPTPSELIEAADQALYRSKRMGKNCVSRAGGWTPPPETDVLKRFPCPRLVGREAALSDLERPLSDGAGGKNRVLLVEASRGLGKSRLLLEVMRRASSRGLPYLFGQCLESNRAIPYSSLAPILTDYLSREPRQQEAARARLSGPVVKELGTLIPVLATPEEALQPIAPEDRRSLLFHGMGDLLALLSGNAPLLIFLDDLQFVDEASLEVLYRLLDRDDGRVLVYAAAQSEALAQQAAGASPLSRLFSLLGESPNFLRLTLSPLTPAEVTQIVTEILERHTDSPGFFQRLYEASQGIPLFVEETLKGLIARGALKTADGEWNLDAVEPAAVPASLEAAILGGLEALDRETQDMISKAAVVGPQVDVQLLAGVLGKNAGETQQLVDQVTKHRVFEEAGPLADEDEVRFLSQCFQQIVYTGLDQGARRRTHRAVGEVAERLAGPHVEQVLGPLAYHFERSDDQVKAEFYRRRVEELSGQLFSAEEVQQEIGLKLGAVDTAPPLDAETWPLAERVLRALTVAVKNMRVYPAGSELVTEGVAGASATLLELLNRASAVSFTEESEALQINGQPVESKGVLPVAQDLLRLYAEHGIRRCTFERGVTQADLMGVLKILSGPSAGLHPDPEFWAQRLKTAGIRQARIFPVLYLAAREGRVVWRREAKEARLDDTTLALVRDALRSLAASVDNIRLYPPESELITLTLDQLERQAQLLFTRVPILTIGMAEDTIVINATRPNPRLFGITIEILERLMEDSGLTSLTIRRGVSREDFRVFLTQLAQPLEEVERIPAFWRSLLEGHGIATIEVGTRMYAAAETLDKSQAAPPEPPPAEALTELPTVEVSEAEHAIRRATEWLQQPLATFLDRSIQGEIPPVLGALRRAEREDLAKRLVERTAGGLGEADAKLRWKASQGLSLSLSGIDAQSADSFIDQILDPLCDALKKETQPEPLRGEVDVAAAALKRLLSAGDLSRGGRLAEALGAISRGPMDAVAQEVMRALADSLAAAGALEAILNALKDPDPTRHQQANAILAGLGAGVVPLLLRVILEGQDEQMGRAAAALLRVQGEASVRLLTQEIERTASVVKLMRIVAVLDVILPTLGDEWLFFLGHPDVEVRAAMARTLSRFPREQALRFLRQALSQPAREVLLGALECVRGLRGVELLDTVITLAGNPPNDDLLRATCLCLGGLRDARAVPPLLGVLERRPRFFGLVKGLPDGIRATAARSLGELAFPEVRRGLETSLKDPSKTVRSAARLALLRVQQQLEAKPKK